MEEKLRKYWHKELDGYENHKANMIKNITVHEMNSFCNTQVEKGKKLDISPNLLNGKSTIKKNWWNW